MSAEKATRGGTGTPVRVAVLGAGWWANEAHLPALADDPRAEIAVVHSRDREQARRSAERFRCGRFTDSVEEALGTPGLQAAVVASTPNAHRIQAVAALRRGLHVLVEKPLALSSRDARRIQAEAESRRLHVVVSSPWQFTAHAERLRGRLARGAGPLRSAHILMTNWVRHLADRPSGTAFPSHLKFVERPDAASYSDPAVCGGGVSFNQLCHALAWLFYVAPDEDPAGVSALFEMAGASVDLFASFLVRLKGGGIVTLTGVGDPPPSRRAFEARLFLEQAAASLELWKGEAEWLPRKGRRETWKPLSPAEIYPRKAPANMLVSLALGMKGNPSPLLPAMQAVRVIEAALKSANAGGRWTEIAGESALLAAPSARL